MLISTCGPEGMWCGGSVGGLLLIQQTLSDLTRSRAQWIEKAFWVDVSVCFIDLPSFKKVTE